VFNKLRKKETEENLEQKTDKSFIDVKNHLGTVYVTQNSRYEINENGEFKGRPSIEGAQISMAAGIDDSVLKDFIFCMSQNYESAMNEFDELVRKYGQKVRPGLHLIACLTPEARKEKQRVGIITTPLIIVDNYGH
jgi:hypothetical protein